MISSGRSTADSAEIVRATSNEAPAILGILTEAFRSSSLKFSIYQSPRAVDALRGEIQREDGAVFVSRRDREVDGFYIAALREREFFLSYIASAGNARGRGTGGRLLEHFEKEGTSRGCTTFGLDAFRSNPEVIAWYARRGYHPRGERYRVRFDMANLAADGPAGLSLDPAALAVAAEQESSRGFSRVDGLWRGEKVSLGFIGGTVCNLIEPEGVRAIQVAEAVAHTFRSSRRWLLMSSREPLPRSLSPETTEAVLYMNKPAIR